MPFMASPPAGLGIDGCAGSRSNTEEPEAAKSTISELAAPVLLHSVSMTGFHAGEQRSD